MEGLGAQLSLSLTAALVPCHLLPSSGHSSLLHLHFQKPAQVLAPVKQE